MPDTKNPWARRDEPPTRDANSVPEDTERAGSTRSTRPQFTSEHEIAKVERLLDQDDWLPYAEDLVEKWASLSRKEVKFEHTFDIQLAALLLVDDLLPPSARAAFADLMLDTIAENRTKKHTIECLRITPPPPGRKQDLHFRSQVIFGTHELIAGGLSKTEAYRIIAEEHSKSPDTIRRIYERARKKKK